MFKRTFAFFILFLGLFFYPTSGLKAQNDLSSEDALRKEAQKSFDDEEYGTALKYYSRLLSVNQKDPLYNYRYGVCLLNASPDKEEAIKYLTKAAKDPSAEKEVFYYYGRALQLNYRFNDAIAAFTKYKGLINETKVKKMQVDHLIETCKNGQSLLRKITDLQVTEKKDLSDKDFFLSYDLSDIGGRLLVKPDDFKTALDKKKKENSIIFLSQDKTEIFFSSYGSSDENGKDIYVIKLLPSGEYSKPISLGYPINTEYDEDYPFLHPNGKVLYFASKGHNSMGGYDIFKSERNEETGTWGKPVNLDFAINTPDDDFLFVTDKEEKTAYFASRRTSENGRVDVYHINTQRKPVDICIFKGKFIPRKEGQSQVAKITVKNVDINEVEGVFKSAEGSGDYTLNLPNGGKFLIMVETQEGDIQSDVLVIPQQFEIVPIRQEITYNEANGGKMVVHSFFGQSVAGDDNYSLALDFIRERSKLDVNTSRDSKEPISLATDKADTASASKVASSDTTHTRKNKNLSNEDLVNIATQDAKDLEKESVEARDAADKALVIVNEKNQKAQEMDKKVEEALASAAATADPAQKQIEQARADALQIQANTAETEALAANNFYQSLSADADKKKKEADLSAQYAQDLDAAIKSKSKDAMTRLEAQKEALDKLSEEKANTGDVATAISREAAAKQKEVNKVRNESARIRYDIRGIEAEIVNLKHEDGATKNEQLKAGIASQIAELKTESKTKEKDLTENDLKLGKLQKEAENLNNQAFLVQQMNERIRSGQVNADAGTIDKEKLNQQISAYHPKSADVSPVDTGAYNPASGKETLVTEFNTPKDTSAHAATSAPTAQDKKQDASFAKALAEAGSSTSEVAKEEAKSAVYKDWSEDLTTRIQDRKAEIKKTDNKEKQQQILTEIASLEKEQQEKQSLQKESETTAAKLKASEALATSTEAKNNQVNTSITEKNLAAGVEENAYVPVYTSKLAAAESLPNATDREKAKAEALKEWTAAIDGELLNKKKSLESVTEKAEKEKLQEQIAALESESADKKAKQKASETKVLALKKGDNQSTDKTADYAVAYSNQLGQTDSLSSPAAKDSARAKVYQNWTEALTREIESKKELVNNTKDQAKKKAIQEQISDLETERAGKEAAGRVALARSNKNKTASTDKAIAGINPTTDYHLPDALTAVAEGARKSTEAVQLKSKADSLLTVSSSLDGEAQVSALKEAEALDKASRESQLASSTAISKASETEFQNNRQTISQYAAQPSSQAKGTGVDRADALTLESTVYFEKAKKKREQAAAGTSFYASQEALKAADEDEHLALSKQAEAIQLYAAVFPAFKPADNKSSPVVVANTTATSDKGAISATPTDPLSTVPVASNTPKSTTDKTTAGQEGTSNATTPGVDKPVLKENAVTEASKEPALTGTTGQETTKEPVVTGTARQETTKEPILTGTAGQETNNGKVETASTSLETKKDTSKQSASPDIAVVANPLTDGGTINATEPSKNGVREPGKTDTTKTDHALVVSSIRVDSATLVAAAEQKKEEGIRQTDTYKKYILLKSEMDYDQAAVKANNTEANNQQKIAQDYLKQAKEMQKSADTLKDETAKAGALQKAKEYEDLSAASFAKSDEARARAKTQNETASEKVRETNNLLTTLDPAAKESYMALAEKDKLIPPANNTILKTTPATAKNTAKTTNAKTGDGKTPAGVNTTQPFASNTQAKTDNPKTAVSNAAVQKPGADKTTTRTVSPAVALTTPSKTNGKASAEAKPKSGSDKTAGDKTATKPNSIPVALTTPANGKSTTAAVDAVKPQKTVQPVTEDQGTTNTTTPESKVVANTNGQPPSDKKASIAGGTTPSVLSGVVKEDFMITSVEAVPKAIAMDEQLPAGLLFKVQIGAFRKPISGDLFRGIRPLTGETTPLGFIRYTAGIFTLFESADKAKNEIHSMGFSDAFVVAFYNGKRISLNDPIVLAGNPTAANVTVADKGISPAGYPNPIPKNKKTTPDDVTPAIANNTVQPTNQNNPVAAVPANVNNQLPAVSTEAPKATAVSTPVNEVKGLFYTVQVGVFSNAVTNEKLYNIRPLNSEKLANGTIRYTTGQYSDVARATEAKNKIVQLGVKDAFVVAYYNGRKMSVKDANSLNSGGPSGTIATPAVTPESPQTQPRVTETIKSTENPVPSARATETNGAADYSRFDNRKVELSQNDSGVVFKVQIGAFKEEVPIEIANKFLLFAKRGVSNFKADNGNTVFTIGRVRKFDDAQFLKEEAIAKGIPDAFILAFKDGKSIPVSEAKGAQ